MELQRSMGLDEWCKDGKRESGRQHLSFTNRAFLGGQVKYRVPLKVPSVQPGHSSSWRRKSQDHTFQLMSGTACVYSKKTWLLLLPILRSNYNSHQLQPGQRLQQARRQPHPTDDATQRRVLLHLHQRAHLQTRLSSGRRGRSRWGRGSGRRGLGLLSHHRLDREGERPMTHAVNGPGLAVQAEGQRVELVVTGQRGRGRGSGGRGGLVEVRGRFGKWLGGVLPNCRNKKAKVNIHFEGKNPSCYVNCLYYCRDALRVFNE